MLRGVQLSASRTSEEKKVESDLSGRNNKDCHMSPVACRLASARPIWLIDTWRLCLAPGAVNAPYVALSYVWRKEHFFETRKKDLHRLQLDQAFFDFRNRLGRLRAIEDAIKLLGHLEERYLWVDALCIVQDDDEARHNQVQKYGFNICQCGDQHHSKAKEQCWLWFAWIERHI